MKYVWLLIHLNPLSAETTKWSNTFKQFVGFCRLLPTNCLSGFDNFVRLALKGLKAKSLIQREKGFFLTIHQVPAGICLFKVNMEILEKRVNMFKVNNKRHQTRIYYGAVYQRIYINLAICPT